MTIRMARVPYHGWANCVQLSNGLVDVIVTADVGPRVIRFGFDGRGNEFAEFEDQLGKTGGREWRIYGGHRLWHAPEERPRTYAPDNEPVACKETPDGLLVSQPVETATGIQKELLLALAHDRPALHITHRLVNRGPWPVELAAWALTMMAPGGTAVVPLPPRGSHEDHLQPVQSLALWAYTDLSDPRWTWGREFILLRQDPHWPHPQKFGCSLPAGWLAYWRAGHLFVKRAAFRPEARYPDLGSSAEVFTDDRFLELETLSPLVRLEPGRMVEHVEIWELYEDVPPIHTERDVQAHLLPLLDGAQV